MKEVIIDKDIGHFKGFFNEELCNNLISFFQEMKKVNLSIIRDYKKDGIVDNSTNIIFPKQEVVRNNTVLKLRFHDDYTRYCEKYIGLQYIKRHMIYDMKIQKTPPEGGFYRWHIEKDSHEHRDRFIAFMLYLNTVESGGETEFLHQRVKFKPSQGDFLMWPAGYTHLHRGDPPFSEDKYILTGWVEFE
jgi:hypothetical protein